MKVGKDKEDEDKAQDNKEFMVVDRFDEFERVCWVLGEYKLEKCCIALKVSVSCCDCAKEVTKNSDRWKLRNWAEIWDQGHHEKSRYIFAPVEY